MEEIQTVVIKKTLFPDAQAVINRERYNGDVEYKLVSLLLSENMIIVEDCDEDGLPSRSSYREPEYYACRLNSDMIEMMDIKVGWVPTWEELNRAHFDKLANKELLGDNNE